MPNVRTIDQPLVLVVDDDSDVRDSISQLLDAKGYSIIQAENGQKALNILKSTSRIPCLIVLDLVMPVMDGYRFLTLRAQTPTLRNIPVVVTSANPQAGATLTDIDTYLTKPVNVDHLIDVIDQHC
jgi:two-component system, OmpR family, response regulator CpxR